MMPRPGTRPVGLKPPPDLPPSPPVPEPQAAPPRLEHAGRAGADPTRYGDWEIKGVAVDF